MYRSIGERRRNGWAFDRWNMARDVIGGDNEHEVQFVESQSIQCLDCRILDLVSASVVRHVI
jgi:hypothetical protein